MTFNTPITPQGSPAAPKVAGVVATAIASWGVCQSLPNNGPQCADARENSVTKIEPNLKRYGLGEDIGWFDVREDRITLSVMEDGPLDSSICRVIDPDLAPLFRMIANRLDEISGKRQRMA
jgi:hypothetical protein